MSGTARSCSFCGKAETEVQQLASGRSGVVCTACLDGCDGMLRDLRRGNAAGRLASLVCSFCGKDGRRHLLSGGLGAATVHICDECVERLRRAIGRPVRP